MLWSATQTRIASLCGQSGRYEAVNKVWFCQTQRFDGIVRYISTWFLGHLCKMLHIKNSYSRMYEDAIEKLRVDRPELDEEDDEDLFNDIFGDDGAGGGAQ